MKITFGEARKAVTALVAGIGIVTSEFALSGTVSHVLGTVLAVAGALGVFLAKNDPNAKLDIKNVAADVDLVARLAEPAGGTVQASGATPATSVPPQTPTS